MKCMLRVLLLSVLALSLSPVRAKTYAVVVGIASYQNIPGLVLTENDAKSVAALYKAHSREVITMTGRYATRSNILKALGDQFARAKEGDMVVFFFSGHGYAGGFCPYDMGRRFQNGLSYEDVYSVFRRSKATRKVVIADACMSGGLRKEKKTRGTLPCQSSDVLMFLSSRGNEYSMENRRMTNGFFTACLCSGLRGSADMDHNRVITAKELFAYVSRGVKRLSGGRQHPVMWGHFSDDFIMMDWR